MDLLIEKYMNKIIYKDENILENRTMKNTGRHMKVGKSTNTMNVNKVQKITKFERLYSLICLVWLFTILFRCAVAISGTSIRPTKPRESLTIYDKYIYISKHLFCMYLFSNVAVFLYCAVFQACRLVAIKTKYPDRSLLCLLSFVVGAFLSLLISDRVFFEQRITQSFDPNLPCYISLGLCCNVIVSSIIFDDDYVEWKELNKIKIQKLRWKKSIYWKLFSIWNVF